MGKLKGDVRQPPLIPWSGPFLPGLQTSKLQAGPMRGHVCRPLQVFKADAAGRSVPWDFFIRRSMLEAAVGLLAETSRRN